MSRTLFDSLITEKALSFINDKGNLIDHVMNSRQTESLPEGVLEGLSEDQAKEVRQFHETIFVETKNVCAKVSPALAKEIDDVCSVLSISKRRFLEAAYIEAVNRAKAIMEEEGVYDAMRDQAA